MFLHVHHDYTQFKKANNKNGKKRKRKTLATGE